MFRKLIRCLCNGHEEGLWTPGISFGGGTTGIAYSTQKGIYARIGKLVTAQFSITLTSKGSSTGIACITGLPIAAQGQVGYQGGGFATYWQLLAVNYSCITFIPNNSGDAYTADIYGSISPPLASLGAVLDTSFNNSCRIDGTVIYQV
jgi:hypothetical protein